MRCNVSVAGFTSSKKFRNVFNVGESGLSASNSSKKLRHGSNGVEGGLSARESALRLETRRREDAGHLENYRHEQKLNLFVHEEHDVSEYSENESNFLERITRNLEINQNQRTQRKVAEY